MTGSQHADIIPTYTLGASQLLTFKGSAWLSRKLQISLGVFWGWRFTPIPRPHPMITLVGRPIPGTHLPHSQDVFVAMLKLGWESQAGVLLCRLYGSDILLEAGYFAPLWRSYNS